LRFRFWLRLIVRQGLFDLHALTSHRGRLGIKPILGNKVAIYRLLQGSAFDPDAVERIAAAYEDALLALKVTDRADPVSEALAKKIFEIAQTGEREPSRISALALKELGAANNKRA
jgi:hypothetical protein